MSERGSEQEIGQMRSVIGSLGWVARQCRPDLSYEVSKGQSCQAKATLDEMKAANEAVKKMMAYSDTGLYYRAGVLTWNSAVLVTITDASFAQESYEDDKGRTKLHRSQKARMHLLCSPEIMWSSKAACHIIGWSSTTDKRVASSTMQAEGHAMITGTDQGDRLRCAIASAYRVLDMQKWEQSAAKVMPHLWLSDCNALVSHVLNPKDEKLENTRLSLDIAMIKQRLWTDPDGESYEDLPITTAQELYEKNKPLINNIVRWIDTSAMVVDCMTKRMKADTMYRVMDGVLDLTPTPESILCKSRKAKGRAKAKPKATDGCDEAEAEAVNDSTAQDYQHDSTAQDYQHGYGSVHAKHKRRNPAKGKGKSKTKDNAVSES